MSYSLHEFETKVVQLIIAQRMMCIFEAFERVSTKIVFSGNRFSACWPDSAPLFSNKNNIFRCIFQLRTKWDHFLIVTFGKILQDGQKTLDFSIFRRFSFFSLVRFTFRYRTQQYSCSARWDASIECCVDVQIESLKIDSKTCDSLLLVKYKVSWNLMYIIVFSTLDNPSIDVCMWHDFWNANQSPSCWVLWENVS